MLTQRQREVYEFVVSYVDSHGYPPTVREIGEAVGLASPSTFRSCPRNCAAAMLRMAASGSGDRRLSPS